MKKLIILFLLCFSAYGNINISVGEDYTHTITFSDSGVHQTGETIVLSIKKNSNGYWFDFDDNTFKASGWASKTVTLTEDSTNHNYYYTWESQGGDTSGDSYIFHAECSGEFIVEETIIFENTNNLIRRNK